MQKIDVSIIIPSYNETLDVKRDALKSINEYLKKQKYSYEVIIVDDESTNGTLPEIGKIVKSYKDFSLIENKHGGKAITVMTGLLNSSGQIAFYTDMDQATPIDQLEKLLPKFKEGYDIVIGSRSGRRGAPLIRKLTAVGYQVIRTLILGLPFKDTQCGFKGFTRQAIESIFPEMLNRWQQKHTAGAAVNAGFDAEFLLIAKKKNFQIAEVPVDWHHVGSENVQIIRDSWDAVVDMLKIRWRDLKGDYR